MGKQISIHKAEHHKLFYSGNKNNDDVLEVITSSDLFVYPLKDKGYYYLYNIKKNKILAKSKLVLSFKLGNNIESILLMGITVKDAVQIKIPESVHTLIFEGGDLMPKQMSLTKKGDVIWKKIQNHLHLYKFITSIEERIAIEKELRLLYNNELPKHIPDFGLSELFDCIKQSNITKLEVRWTYISDQEFKMISNLNQLESLAIWYCYNDSIKWFPKALKSLKVYGTTIQRIPESIFDLLQIYFLDLEGNNIQYLNNLHRLPSTIKYLDLGDNLISYFEIGHLPKSLESLFLTKNQIANGFFDQITVHKNLKILSLSFNNLIITGSILRAIMNSFPNLVYLELLGNRTDGVPEEFLGDEENKNCILNVQYYLDEIDYKHNSELLILTKSETKKNYIEVIWSESLLPLKVILRDLQYVFSMHFGKMPSFKQYLNGLSCTITFDNCDIFIQLNEKQKNVVFKVQSVDPSIVAVYFHKYLHEINWFIDCNSHVDILPYLKSSSDCSFLKEFYAKVFKLDYKVKGKPVVTRTENETRILINNRKIDHNEYRPSNKAVEEGKTPGIKYINKDFIAFILVSGKSAYPFILKNNKLTNALDSTRDNYYYITLRTAEEKDHYVKAITSSYLNRSQLVQTDVFIDNDIKRKVSCYVNPDYFKTKDNILSTTGINNPVLKEKLLKDVKMDNGKYCEFSINDNHIELKYVY